MGNSSSNKHIIVLEDDPDIAAAVVCVLSDSGYACAIAENIASGRRLIFDQRQPYDMIVADISLPDGECFDLLEELKADGRNTESVIISAHDDELNILRALQTGAVAFLQKPFSNHVLLDAVDLTLSRTRTDEHVTVDILGKDWVEITIPSHLEYVRRIEDFIKQLARRKIPGPVIDETAIAFREILSNSIEWGHGNDISRPVGISYLIMPDRIVFRIDQDGAGFNWQKEMGQSAGLAADPIAVIEERQKQGKRPGGWGLMLARSFIDSIVFNQNGNSVILTKYIHKD